MSNIGNKKTMAKNINYYLTASKKSRSEVCKDLGFAYSTFTEWANGRTYPRIDKIEMMANYFGIEKSDLIEEHDQHFMTRKEIGTAVYEARKAKNITLEDLAQKVGCSTSFLTKIEKGNSYILTKDVAKKLSDVLGLSLLLIVGLESITPEQQQAEAQKEKQRKLWADAYAEVEFSDDEFEDIMRYANFIISKRK